MDNYIKKHLQDIITAIEEIESFTTNGIIVWNKL